MKTLNEIKNEFKVNHAARMVNLEKTIESSQKPESPEKTKNTKNTKRLEQLNNLLASL